MSLEVEGVEGVPRFPVIESTEKRVVLRSRSGLDRIVGTLIGPPPELIVDHADQFAPAFSLLKVTTRYILYLETQPLQGGRFNESHPNQV